MAMVNTIPMPEKMAPATKYGGKIVACQPGVSAIAKSNDTTECTESTSGVANAARNRYARVKWRHSRSEFRQPSEGMARSDLRTSFVTRSARRALSGIRANRDGRNQADVEEGARDREVREDREHVPHQRALRVRPDESPVRIRNQVEELPRPAEVQDREQSCRHDGEHRHGFRHAVNA